MLLALSIAVTAAVPELGQASWPAEVPRPVGAVTIDAGDYAAEALRNGEQGSLRVALDVDADGQVTGARLRSRAAHAASTTGRAP
jgi:outer membrane biosynthesis protein TonB